MNGNNNHPVQKGGIGFLGALALLFIGLKLAGIITWSWVWVLAPLWIPLAVVILLCVVYFIAGLVENLGGRR